MAPLRCCGFRRSLTPEPEPVRLVESSQTTRRRFALSSHASSTEMTDVRPVREIFASASKDESSYETPAESAHDLPKQREVRPGIHRSESSRRLHEAASKVRKRMSRDSGMSKRSSKKTLRSSLSTEDIERRNELKRALQKRVEDDILEDLTASDNSYDEDAVPIKTPGTTWGRHEGTIQISPKHLSKALRRSDEPSRPSYTELKQRDLSQAYAPKSMAVALSRMLTQRASHLSGESDDQVANTLTESPKRKRSSKKYIFDDEDTPKKVPETRTPSPLTRANTVIRVTPSAKPLEKSFTKLTFVDTLEAPPSPPDLMPTRLESISDSVAGGDWCLSFSERCKGVLPVKLSRFHKPTAGAPLPVVYGTKVQPASEQWLHGASGLLSPKIHQRQISHEHNADSNKESHHCDPSSEEMGFGGIDGEDDSPPESAYVIARTRNHSEESEAGHLYNMHIPQRLASKTLLLSASLPQLQEPQRKRSYTCGDSSDFSTKPRRQVSTPEIVTSKIPMAWDNPGRRATSSVYSSQPESLYPSRRNSVLRITSLQDRVQQFKDHQTSANIISVSPKRMKSVDLDRLERRTGSTSFHSSNESLTNKDLAASDRRISSLPRANTLPKNSRFKEELEQISAELALTNPPRRRFSNLDGSGEATSVWEKTLREHSREDAALSHTRPGSYSPDPDRLGPMDFGPKNEAPSSSRTSTRPPLYRGQDHISVGAAQGSNLQARLAAYKLPTYVQTPKKRPLLDETKRSTSAYPIGSWARYPSHSRPERSSSPARLQDQVFTRDFADMTPGNTLGSSPTRQGSKLDKSKRKKSMSFGKNMISSLTRLYKSRSQELQRMLANEARGHRSSISEGGVLEYPELEMLGSLSPPMPSPDIDTKNELEEIIRSEIEAKAGGSRCVAPPNSEADQDAKQWSKLYEDCVVPSPPGVFSTSPTSTRSKRVSAEDGPKDSVAAGPKDAKARQAEESGSSELRASTLDFKKSLEEHEGLARERALGLMERISA
ncbi:hypothetical protein OEA41_003246 [Lepraria neglecta]|uniref:Uncharacterized protein n=1 Tax=Lepraria neglecta TaxID=209136 RepID=A0AAE0DI56_9LECA|nr:hypothetical protein OEA41_003246 [Lepraria neglecta]